MIAYKQSDIKFSWMGNESANAFPKVCGYVKEGAGKCAVKSQIENNEC